MEWYLIRSKATEFKNILPSAAPIPADLKRLSIAMAAITNIIPSKEGTMSGACDDWIGN